MGEQSRRAQKKALTRAHVQATARRLFGERGFDAVTVADVAATADVAVQTVFNHFATKEELYWAGRAPWVTGPAEAVRTRPAGVAALDALRGHLVDSVGCSAERLGTAEGRCTVAAVERSPALQAAERELHHEAERLLTAALEEAWRDEGEPAPADPGPTAALVAATWLSVTRTLVVGLRAPLPAPADVPALAAGARRATDRLLTRLAAGLAPATACPRDDGAVRGALRAV